MKLFGTALFLLLLIFTVSAQENTGFSIAERTGAKQIDILYNKTVVASYRWGTDVGRPVLTAVKALSGIPVTRGFPLAPEEGERIDRPFEAGIFMGHESVNGLDFWNTQGGKVSILHDRVVKKEASATSAVLEVSAQWREQNKIPLVVEGTRYEFSISGPNLLIDRITTFIALREDVTFADKAGGFVGIRLARAFELPGQENVVRIDREGKPGARPVAAGRGVTGVYTSSEGVSGETIAATNAKWVTVSATIGDKPVSVTVVDHSSNNGYPTRWNVSGRGLVAANPFGSKAYGGRERPAFVLHPAEQVEFKYRFIIHEGPALPDAEVRRLAEF